MRKKKWHTVTEFNLKGISSGIFIILMVFSVTRGEAQKSYPFPFGPGENLRYQLNYTFITAGEAILQIDRDTLERRYVHHIKAEAKTTGVFNTLYGVRDIYESWYDPASLLPRKAIRNIKEGRYRKYNVVLFDHFIRPDSAVVHSQAKGKVIVPKETYDILTGFLLFRKNYRNYPFEKNETILIQTYFTDELWPLKIRYKGEEQVKLKIGKVNCYKFSPVTEVGRAFKSQEDMYVWFSDDENFLPVKIWFNLRVGSFKVELDDFSGLKHPFTSLIPSGR
ncbi:MAG: DUF3108 domain-containing protein [Chlorobi bacterium]|nr:DUF3108 domain-containing protein [Chlorobiota bacterium]